MVGYPIGPMTPLHERIALIMRDHPDLAEPGGVGRLARVAGVSSSAVSQWKSPHHTATMSAPAAARIAERYGYRLVWLVEGKGPRFTRSSAQNRSNEGVTADFGTENTSRVEGVVPVVGVMYMTSSGAVERFTEEDGPAGGVRVHSSDPDACAIRLMGESVGIFRAGWYVLIEPSAALVPGEPVLVTLTTGKRVLGELLAQTDGSISLLGLSGGTRMAFLKKDVAAMYPVSAVVSPSKFVA